MPASAELTASETALLIVLMAEARDVSNKELKDRFELTLTGESRRKLNDLKYVESWMEGRAYSHRLTDKGWARCGEPMTFKNPQGPKQLAAALTALLGGVQRDLQRTNRSLADVFGLSADLTADIRGAYAQLAKEPGAWVSLADLRDRLDAPAEDVDDALRKLERERDVNIVPQANQKALGAREKAAAVHIGGQDKYFLAIGV